MGDLSRILILLGVILLAAGGLLALFSTWLPGTFRLPGDIVIRRGSFTFYFPVMTSLLLSLLLTLLAQIFFRR